MKLNILSMALLCGSAAFAAPAQPRGESSLAERTALTVFTPAALYTCEPALLLWTGGEAPFTVSIIPGDDAGAAPLETFAPTEYHDLTWVVNLAAETTINVEVEDAAGEVNYSAEVTIQAGSSTTCL